MPHSHSHFDLIPEQLPAPHSRNIRHTGGKIRITLTLPRPVMGRAFVRTNLGQARIKRREVVESYDSRRARMARDWWDIPMRQTSPRHFEVVLPICEVGIYEFKACFVDDATGIHHWPRGENACVKAEPALYAAQNSIYNAFVRQFGPNISASGDDERLREAAACLDNAGYTVLPPSGTFRDIISKLDFIQGELGFRIIQLLPIHPTPTTYGRMGRFGSPFAPVDFYSVDPALANFDRRATPLDQFNELTDQIHCRGGLVFLDLPIDHTGWASTMQLRHPEWFHHNPDGSFQSPGAWGVVWEDLCKLDFDHRELWREMANVFLHWCRNGVDGFRCDAGYMIPHDVWEYIIARVRQEYPDTLFFLEGLGGGIDATTRLLASAGMNWAYSELFQNYSTQEISSYLDQAVRFSRDTGALVNFAETHDNDRLAARSPSWSALRVAIAALFAPGGCFGIANGVEWLATEKIDVHESRSLNWGAELNIIPLISRLNMLAASHPAFRADAELRVPFGAGGTAVGLLRVPADSPEDAVLVIANPNLHTVATYEWNFKEFDTASAPYDLLSGRKLPVRSNQCQMQIQLKPAEVLCLSLRPRDIRHEAPAPEFIQTQLLRQTVLKFLVARNGYGDIGNLDIDTLARALYQNPLEFLKRITGENIYLPVVEWKPEMDRNRVVPLPPAHHILINHPSRFIASVYINGKCHQKIYSNSRADGRFFALFQPLPAVNRCTYATLRISTFRPDGGALHLDARILLLPPLEKSTVNYRVTRQRLNTLQCGIATTDLGGYSLARARWASLESQYDALLAVNQHPSMPVDRTIILNRCRLWVIYRDFSTEVDANCQTGFAVTGPDSMRWDFIVPTGMGGNINLAINSRLDRKNGKLQLTFTRLLPKTGADNAYLLDSDTPVTLLIRPDVDDRSFHGNTVASEGAEREFPLRVTALGQQAFAFRLASGNRLEMRAMEGIYVSSPEWHRNVFHAIEAERGLKAEGDLYSPGYFKLRLMPDSSAAVEAQLMFHDDQTIDILPVRHCTATEPAAQNLTFVQALDQAMEAFVVRRDEFKSIIAGYPWFLDWGRDTLICTRGLIAAGRMEDAMAIIRKFASFEENGTLPNMISGQHLSNRDTSDAQLLLFLAVIDYVEAAGKRHADSILNSDCGGRSLRQVLVSIADNYIKGTPNGICADPATGLVYSPPHFTWMDTNYPAATPREGYPVEIQAYWFAALRFLAEYADENGVYRRLAEKVRDNFLQLYPAGRNVGLSDCLHAAAGVSALDATADDHARPNQLFAITLGLVEEPELRRHIVRACSSLLVPGAMRSLADQPVAHLLPVVNDGIPCNDPAKPYWGNYSGDENTRRKPAYHNGTAWCLQMPLYCEALFMTYGESAKEAAGAILGTAAYLMGSCCVGHLPEIIDGSSPHTPRGCSAQAWSVTECRRVLKMLK